MQQKQLSRHASCRYIAKGEKMTAQNQSTDTFTPRRRHGGLLAGIILILIGLSSLLAILYPAIDFDRYFLLLLGIIFLVWGNLRPSRGLLIPGGILTGLGAAVLLTSGIYSQFTKPVDGGIFLLVFAGGWLLIPLFTALFARPVMWWPTIPAAFIAVFGVALLASSLDPQVLDYLNKGWPLILIVIGLYLILRHREMQH
jgi:hypothetical protein